MVLLSDQIILRAKGLLEFKCQLETTDASHVQQVISNTFEALRCKVRSESLVLSVCNSSVFTWPNKGVGLCAKPDNITANTPCKEILQLVQTDEVQSTKKSAKTKKYNVTVGVINMRLMTEVTEPSQGSVPVLHRGINRKHRLLHAALPVDCVLCVPVDETVKVALDQMVDALTRQLCDMETATLRHMEETEMEATMLVPQPFHFLLPESTGLVTVVYPSGVPDSKLEGRRRELHGEFALPEDRPYLRRANAFHFPDENYKDGYLRNPHAHLNPPALENAKLYLTQGVYSYHHYMQDRVDDNGWGCAYRSLQTICSWFQQQGYVERAVPTHREIQRALVDVGDKQPNFVGSRQWIGSIEVQAVLDHLLGVTSKIMFVSQGSELASKGRELANHFLVEGTPVMIGGGVLAHTILGVAWSETTGEIRFLILDPHYTGGEDLQTVTERGWCGWKGPEFWDQNAYYNLCLPQRPSAI